MKTLPLTDILIPPDRQRREFPEAEQQKLIASITENGLLAPIVLRADRRTLIAGERRLRAISDIADLGGTVRHDGDIIPAGHIPFVTIEELHPTAAELAEYEENICRRDLTWQERARATARIQTLRATLAAERGLPPPSMEELARDTRDRGGSSAAAQTATRRDITLAAHLDRPEVQAAKSADEAWKALRRAEETDRATALGESVGRTFTRSVHRVFNTNALDFLLRCPDAYFDCILTDPPFGMGAHEFGDGAGTVGVAHGYADDDLAFQGVLDALTHSVRVTKPAANLYLFCDIDRFDSLRTAIGGMGWTVHRTPMVWHNESKRRIPWAGPPPYGPQRKYELILYACKDKRAMLKHGGDVLRFDADENLGHAAQKPVALYTELLSRTCRPGDTTLDLYCGSGPIFPAAHGLKVAATGVDSDVSKYGIAVKRLEELK